MPAPRKLTRRAEKVNEVQREQNPQVPEEPQQPAQRPRTRAWTKQEEQRKEEAIVTSSASHPKPAKVSLEQSSLPRHAGSSLRARPGTHTPSLPVPPEAADRQAETPRQHRGKKSKDPKASHEQESKGPLRELQSTEELIQDFPLRQSRVSPPRRPALSTWLDQLQPTSPEDSRALPVVNDLPLIGCPSQSDPSMESSSSASRTSRGPSEGVSTVKGKDPSKQKQLNWDKIRLRRIRDKRTEDDRLDHFKSVLNVKPIQIRFKDTKGLQSILRNFLQRCDKARPNDDSYAAIEDLSNQFGQWRPGVNLVSITNREFEMDVSYCKRSNEAVLQRTVMTSIIDRWQLHELFVYNCEGQWHLPDIFRLPVRLAGGDKVTLPKPDLAVSFTLEAFTGTDTSSPFPKEIDSCMRPDRGVGRCFPFLFMEVKRGAHDLESASMANLHSASQALFNIYIWMSQAGHQETFFNRVRIFSIVLNAQEISMRVHRAISMPGTSSLSYHFDEIVSINGYNRDQASLLFRNVLIEYGKKELHGILKSTFEEVSRQVDVSEEAEDGQLQGKRKADTLPNASSKKVRSEGTADSPLDVASSFGASALEIT